MFYITGDTHGDFARVFQFVKSNPDITLEDTLTVFCIHGNHEMRPESVGTYREILWRGGIVYQEEQYPNLLLENSIILTANVYLSSAVRTV